MCPFGDDDDNDDDDDYVKELDGQNDEDEEGFCVKVGNFFSSCSLVALLMERKVVLRSS